MVRARARPGQRSGQGERKICWRASRIINPQSAVGGWTPRPRKDRLADAQPEQGPEGDGAEAQEQRRGPAEERAGQEIAAVLIGSEQVLRARSLETIEDVLLRDTVRRDQGRQHGEREHAAEDQDADGQGWVRPGERGHRYRIRGSSHAYARSAAKLAKVYVAATMRIETCRSGTSRFWIA